MFYGFNFFCVFCVLPVWRNKGWWYITVIAIVTSPIFAVQEVQPKTTQGVPGRLAQARASEQQEFVSDHGSRNSADGAMIATGMKLEQTSPRKSPAPQSHRVLTPPITKVGEMPFIADRTFPLPASADLEGRPPQVKDHRALSATGVPDAGPRSPSGTGKPPPPPRTVSAKSPPPPDPMARWYGWSSTSEFSTEQFSEATRIHDNLEMSPNFRETEGTTRAVSSQFQTAATFPRQTTHHYEYSPSWREFRNAPSAEIPSPDVVHLDPEPAAVDALFSYHRMTEDSGNGNFSSSSFSSRCSPAVMSPPQPVSSASSRVAVHPTHYYVWWPNRSLC